jgi:membrane dipeptidase
MEDKDNLELRKNRFHIDIEKLRKGNSMAQFFALYVDLQEAENPFETCLDMADKFYIELEKNKNNIGIAANYNQLIENHNQGRISAFLTIEEGGVLKGKISNLRNLHRLGVRLITLTWNFINEIGYPNFEEKYREKGLTSFGKEVVDEMNNLGMLIDVSHLSDEGFYDVARFSSSPFIASHSNARSMTNHSRNLTDDMIKLLANKGGVMGLNFADEFLSDSPNCSIEDMIRHIKHIINVGGIDVIALGSDFDGMTPSLEIEDFSDVVKLIQALEKNGFKQSEIEKICYKNALRIIREVIK